MMFRTIMIVLLGAFVLSGCATSESRVQKIQGKYPQWDKATVQKVAGRQVEVGMTREMVYEALGKPDAVSHEGDEEKWGYAELKQNGWNFYERFVQFIYFKEGKVVKTEKTGRYGPKKGDWHRHRGY
jgi:outer membrane protein assembly factor BamE (lipoprotein component of BamABCDE complex)